MVKIIYVDKLGSLAIKSSRNINLNELYKKCNLKNNKDFEIRHTWNVNNTYYSLYAKTSGRSNNINKYELPPPLDKNLFYGKIVIIKHSEKNISDNNILDSTLDEWKASYEKLFGGFIDLNDDDSEESDELDNISDSQKTKQGYLKDGFVVDDEEDEEDEDYEEIADDEEDEEEASFSELEESELEDNNDNNNNEEEEEEDEEEEEEEDEENYADSDEYSELTEDSYITSDEENK